MEYGTPQDMTTHVITSWTTASVEQYQEAIMEVPYLKFYLQATS